MITDALLAPLVAIVETVLGWLPAGQPLDLPPLGGLWNALAVLDSIVPVMGLVQMMLGLLTFGITFVLVRLVLTVWNLIYP